MKMILDFKGLLILDRRVRAGFALLWHRSVGELPHFRARVRWDRRRGHLRVCPHNHG
jgi:hypothetical protein